jgi:lipoprotein-anchoring transpeptidase ErfK/SrfK
LLIAHGAEKNRPTRSKHRLVPLYFAAWGNHVQCLQTLIDKAPTPAQVRIEISLSAQQATLYKNGLAVLRTEISSGQAETPTPTGQFVVTDKKRHHVSSLYPAKMPFFMRLSCKDFGMHEGHLPGYPASHGCIRLPGDSARKLFRDVPIGTLVTIR